VLRAPARQAPTGDAAEGEAPKKKSGGKKTSKKQARARHCRRRRCRRRTRSVRRNTRRRRRHVELCSRAHARHTRAWCRARGQVLIERATRNKRKCITTVIGLDLFGVKLADASKKFGKKFACGASVTKDASNKEQIDVQARSSGGAVSCALTTRLLNARVTLLCACPRFARLQGDFMDEIAEFICKEWKEVSMDDIKFSDKEKK
jgi:density-regulated protein DRP1